jgi:hypothetical protein
MVVAGEASGVAHAHSYVEKPPMRRRISSGRPFIVAVTLYVPHMTLAATQPEPLITSLVVVRTLPVEEEPREPVGELANRESV